MKTPAILTGTARWIVPHFVLCFGALLFFSGCATAPRPKTAPISNPPPTAIRPNPQPPPSTSPTVGMASYYARKYNGRKTASGEIYDMRKMTAAHRTLPFGIKVRVTELSTGRTVVVRINDRGPFIKGRIIDLSLAAAQRLGIVEAGSAKVQVDILPEAAHRT